MSVDILGNGEFGRDDGIKCSRPGCGGTTFLTDDQGGGLRSYQCETCGGQEQVQFEYDHDDEDGEDDSIDYEQLFYEDDFSPL